MARPLKITKQDIDFLKSDTKQGYNKSVYYERLTSAVNYSIDRLTEIANSRDQPKSEDSDYAKSTLDNLNQRQKQARLAKNFGEIKRLESKIDTARRRLDAYKIPLDKYETILPKDTVRSFIDTIIAGHNRAKNAEGKGVIDVYGAYLAYQCIDVCIRKLEEQWRLAILESNERRYEVLTKKFHEDMKNILGWSDLIYDKVKLADQHNKEKKK